MSCVPTQWGIDADAESASALAIDYDSLSYGRATALRPLDGGSTGEPAAASSTTRSGRASVEQAINDFAAARFVLVVDDADREDEGDLCVAAEAVTPEQVAFMATHACGLVCVAMAGARLDDLELGPMVQRNTSAHTTAFTVSVDARDGTTTGISAFDRAHTIRRLVDPAACAGDFLRPGHVFPLRAADGGVLERRGHTEAAVDLARLAGLQPAGVICEVMNPDGTMARGAQLAAFARLHRVSTITVADLVAFRACPAPPVVFRARCTLPIRGRRWEARAYDDCAGGATHIALVLGGSAGTQGSPLVRMHSCCVTGDVLGSERCDCGAQLDLALRRIEYEGAGVLIYLNGHEGRGIGLANKIRAYALQERGLDTVDANVALSQPIDARDYSAGASILHDLGIDEVRLLTNNAAKVRGLEDLGIRIAERVALRPEWTRHNAAYLQTKRDRLGHAL